MGSPLKWERTLESWVRQKLQKDMSICRERALRDTTDFSNFITAKATMLPLTDPCCALPRLKKCGRSVTDAQKQWLKVLQFSKRHSFTEGKQALPFCMAWYLVIHRGNKTEKRRINCVYLFSSQVICLIACSHDCFSSGSLATALMSYMKRTLYLERPKKRKWKQTTAKDGAKMFSHVARGKLETHHHILESLSHSAPEVGSL